MTFALALAFVVFTVVFVVAFAVVAVALLRSGRLTMRGVPGRPAREEPAAGQEWTASDQ